MDKDISTAELARQVRDSFDGYEMEISFEGEAGLQDSFDRCQKNPGHAHFTPVREFNESCLPDTCNSEEFKPQVKSLLSAIHVLAGITVRIKVQGVSPGRPRGAFMFRQRGDTRVSHTGTGCVSDVVEMKVEDGDKPCPCEQCEASAQGGQARWFQVELKTARHVVHDDVEASATTVEFGYDDEEDRSEVATLKPFRSKEVFNDFKRDIVKIRCASHDERIMTMWREFRAISSKVQPLNTGDETRLVVIASHPHGRGKRITTGFMRSEKVNCNARVSRMETRVYWYDTPTCPGSSGAPIWVVGRDSVATQLPSHSGYDRPLQLNKSGPYNILPVALQQTDERSPTLKSGLQSPPDSGLQSPPESSLQSVPDSSSQPRDNAPLNPGEVPKDLCTGVSESVKEVFPEPLQSTIDAKYSILDLFKRHKEIKVEMMVLKSRGRTWAKLKAEEKEVVAKSSRELKRSEGLDERILREFYAPGVPDWWRDLGGQPDWERYAALCCAIGSQTSDVLREILALNKGKTEQP